MRCETFRHRLSAYLAEQLEGDERAAWRAHLSTCVECRDLALAAEPSLLLVGVRRQPPDPRRVDACAAAVSALIRQERLKRQLRPNPRPWLAAAAALLILATAGVVWRLVPRSGPGGAAPESKPVAAVAAPTAALDSGRLPPPQVEVDMAGEGVRIYHFAAEEDADTALFFIVNPALES